MTKISKTQHITKNGIIKRNPRYIWIGDKFTFETTPDFRPSNYGYYPPETWVPVVIKSRIANDTYNVGFSYVNEKGELTESDVIYQGEYRSVNDAKSAVTLLISKIKKDRRDALDVRKTYNDE